MVKIPTSITPVINDTILRKCFFARAAMNGESGTYFCVHLFVAQLRKIFLNDLRMNVWISSTLFYVFHNLLAIQNPLNAIGLNSSFILVLEYSHIILKSNILFLQAYFITLLVNAKKQLPNTDPYELFASSWSEVCDHFSSSQLTKQINLY